ncbi:hypothetical protein HYW53_00470 [Candidatus Giovannonibacteria bacterium]|nr:hypothetical protein [Candidatus Giovannonibacteria bacterium]
MKVPQTKKSFEAIKSHIIELERPEQILSLIEIIQACCNGMALYILMDDVARQVDKIAAALCVTVYGETVRKRAETLVLLQQRMPC